jgi:hypothetical protein
VEQAEILFGFSRIRSTSLARFDDERIFADPLANDLGSLRTTRRMLWTVGLLAVVLSAISLAVASFYGKAFRLREVDEPDDEENKLISTEKEAARTRAVLSSSIDFDAWLDRIRPLLKPPVANKMLYGSDSSLKVMVVGGPNQRSDYHLQEGEELFLQLKGDLRIDVVEHGRFRTVLVPEGHMYVLPRRVPHSPQVKQPLFFTFFVSFRI